MEGTVKFVIDNREHDLIESIKHETVDIKPLDLGDFNVIVGDQVRVILERKTIADLAQSVGDGRYKEQKQRNIAFRESNHGVMLVYIIEGKFTFDPDVKLQKYTRCNNNTLIGSVINSMFRDKYYVVFTKSVEETALFLKGLMDRMQKKPSEYFDVIKLDKDSYTDSLVKCKKKDNVDVSTCFMMQLCDIPGISSKKAKSIVDHLSVANIKQLVDALQKDPKCLVNISGIGTVLSNKILEYIGI